MPTYVYRCENCGHRFEAWQHMTDDPLTTCPQCEGKIHRVVFPAGIVFKGGGFYSTDNRPTQVATEPATNPAADSDKSAAKPTTEGTGTSATPSTPTESAKPAAPASAQP
jgi:putative FmdB family regulatory protein